MGWADPVSALPSSFGGWMDQELMEELGMKPKQSQDVRDTIKRYLTRLRDQVYGENMARIKVRMKERYIVAGQGVLIPKGHTFMILEGDFDAMNSRCGMKLEKVNEEAAPQAERSTEAPPRVMKAKESVTKD